MASASTYNIIWLKNLTKEHRDLVGLKCANLGEMTRAGFNVPQGFALCVDMYDKFIRGTGLDAKVDGLFKKFSVRDDDPDKMHKYEEISKAIRHVVENTELPDDMEHIIGRYYDKLCEISGIDNVPVAVRSAGRVSHPGQYETYLYVRGKNEFIQNIKKVWSSTFNTRSLLARENAGLPRNYDPIGVAVLQMINAKAAGVIFTLNPANGDRSKIVMEGNWGLGESVVGGYVTPDRWMVDKVVLEIINHQVSNKQIEYVIDPKLKKIKEVAIAKDRQDIPCLSNEEIIELAAVSKKIEKHFGTPQDIEWAVDNDLPFPQNIFFVQSRPETIWSTQKAKAKLKSTGDPSLDVIDFYRTLKV